MPYSPSGVRRPAAAPIPLLSVLYSLCALTTARKHSLRPVSRYTAAAPPSRTILKRIRHRASLSAFLRLHPPAAKLAARLFSRSRRLLRKLSLSLKGEPWGRVPPPRCHTSDAVGNHCDAVSFQTEAPAVVYLLHVGEEPVVQPSELMPKRRPGHHASPAYPENVLRDVVLSLVHLRASRNPPPAEGVSEAVDATARSACILEAASPSAVLVHRQDLRPADSAFRMAVHPVLKRPKPAGRHLDIGVDEYVITVFLRFRNPCEGFVVASCETVIAVKRYGPDLRELRTEHRERTVGAGVVRHPHVRTAPD